MRYRSSYHSLSSISNLGNETVIRIENRVVRNYAERTRLRCCCNLSHILELKITSIDDANGKIHTFKLSSTDSSIDTNYCASINKTCSVGCSYYWCGIITNTR